MLGKESIQAVCSFSSAF